MRLHRSTIIGMAIAGLLALLVLAPVSFAVLSMRSTPESSGASAGAWIVVGIMVLLGVAGCAVAGGIVVALARRMLWRRDRRPSS